MLFNIFKPEFLDFFVNYVFLPGFSFLLALTVNFIIQITRNEKLNRMIDEVKRSAELAVNFTAQTFVDDLKKSGEFNQANAKKALQVALNTTYRLLGKNANKFLGKITENADDYLTAVIEDLVAKNKRG